MPPVSSKPSILEQRIEDTTLPNRARRWLRAGGITTVGDLVQRTEDDLLTIRNFADTSLQHVKEYLAEHGLSLAPPREEPCRAEWVRRALGAPGCRLSRREQRILKLRHGVGTDRPLTLVEVGRLFDLTRERVRQIQKQAEQKVIAYITFRR